MPFGQYSKPEPTERALNNKTLVPIAVLCVFTSTGDMIIKKFKYEDSEQFQHEIVVDRIILVEKKRYAGIPTVKFFMETTSNNKKR